MLFQALEPFGEQVGADPRQTVQEVGKPARTGDQLTDNEQYPAFPILIIIVYQKL
jgi:hypothetical protein